MPHSRFRLSAARERWVLAAGLGAAAALAGAALTVLPDADAAGSAEVARASAEVSRLVQDQWRAALGYRAGLVPLRADLPILPSFEEEFSELPPIRLERDPSATAFDALIATSALYERSEDTLSEALVAIDEALAAAEDDERRARGLLRKIQLAAKAGARTEGVAAWRAIEQTWSPQVVLEDTSLRLIGALAVADLLDDAERALAQSPLALAYEKGELPLPENEAQQAFWADRLQALSEDPGGIAAIARGRARREFEALRSRRTLPERPPFGQWNIEFGGAPPLARWREPGGEELLRFIDLEATTRKVASDTILPSGFQVAFGNEELDLTILRERIEIRETPLTFRIGHEAPERLIRSQIQRSRSVRLGLLLLGAGIAIASIFTARSLRRERRLGELKTRFIAGVSHDLRTPLASILLMAENLEDGRIQDESGRERYYKAIRGEADRLRRLVDDVLDFSRIERGEGAKLKLEDTDLRGFADELEDELRGRVERGGGRLTVDRAGLDHSFTLDRDAVRRALWNLIDNALVHGGGGEIHLGLRSAEEGLVLEVEDSGPGIPASERDKLFEPFRQGASPEAEHAGGSGLGLAIVREIARAHGGRVVVLDGPLKGGALFRITLPEQGESPQP